LDPEHEPDKQAQHNADEDDDDIVLIEPAVPVVAHASVIAGASCDPVKASPKNARDKDVTCDGTKLGQLKAGGNHSVI
jgi:hypothetical protein